MPPREHDLHRALGSPIRRDILLFISDGKKYLSEIAEHIGKTPQTVDFHLGILIGSDLVDYSSEEGKKYYELKDKKILKFLHEPRPLPPGHRHRPPHEIVLDVRDELNARMDRIEKKLDKILEKIKE